MNANAELNRLLDFGLQHGLLAEEDALCAANRLIALMGLPSFKREGRGEAPALPDGILANLLACAAESGLLPEDTPTRRDLLDTAIMGCLMPRPSEVAAKFRRLYAESPQKATDWFYGFCIAANYVRKSRTDKNLSWPAPTPYGDLQITINVSKPEKDPRDIAAALKAPAAGAAYPACLLCPENEGFAGTLGHPARQNLRLIPLELGGERWFFQYSPYVYYNEHCIVLSHEHRPMKVSRRTFDNLFQFLGLLPHYFIGSNADLPIVGGSILTHDHYQGGRHDFPMGRAPVERSYGAPAGGAFTVGRVKWPMSALRLQGEDTAAMAAAAEKILALWRGWGDETVGILPETEGTPHNTITPIARRDGRLYTLDLVLRNNRATKEHPLGLFHPHAEVHHIKKENIGLIEVLGLAILPPRLVGELAGLKGCLARGDATVPAALASHGPWYDGLRKTLAGRPPAEIEAGLRQGVGDKFLAVLGHAGVFKRDGQGLAAFDRFAAAAMASLG